MVGTIGTIKNAISVYKNNWKEIGMPFYLTIFIAFISDILWVYSSSTSTLFLDAITIGIIACAMCPIYAALKNQKIPSWKENVKAMFIKGITIEFLQYGIALGLSVLLAIPILLFLRIILTNIFLILGTVLFFVIALCILLGWFVFLMPEYIIAKKKLSGVVKSSIELYRNNFWSTITFFFVLAVVSLLIMLPMVLLSIGVWVSLVPGLVTGEVSLHEVLLMIENNNAYLTIRLILAFVGSVYVALFILPWQYIAMVSFWDQIRPEETESKESGVAVQKIKTEKIVKGKKTMRKKETSEKKRKTI